MKHGVLSDLDVAPLPFKTNPINLFIVWHRRENDDPAHSWFRQKIINTAHSIFDGTDLALPL
jgi:DNA-binding transcriptional LysR family regulator